jgi:hypothetical protein
MGICDKCGERLIEIDYYGERMTGCVQCNKWGRIGDKNRVLESLGAASRAGDSSLT